MAGVVVLGGTGFVGQHVVSLARENGHHVTSLSRREGCDIAELDQISSKLRALQPEVVVNCAADVGSLVYVSENAADVADANMRMLLNVYGAVQHVCPQAAIINPVANCAFPGNLERYAEELFWQGPPHPSVLPYGSTRRMMVVLGECYASQYGVRTVNFYVPNMYGPRDSTDPAKAHALNALVAKAVKAVKERQQTVDVWGNGTAVREWLYAPDFARLVMESLSRLDDEGLRQPLNVAQNKGFSVKEILEMIVEEAGFEGGVEWDRSKPDGAPRKVMDDTRFRQVFPHFEFADLRIGIRRTIEYYSSVHPY